MVEAVHRSYITKHVIAGNHFAVVRELDITNQVHGGL